MPSFRVLLLDWEKRSEPSLNQRCLGRLECFSRNDYEEAYLLEATDIDEVYRILNVDHPADYRRRSLSVGDLVVTSDSKVLFCAKVGWQDVSSQFTEAKYGQVWDTQELQRDFSVEGFGAPFVVVRRKSDGKKGSLTFQHWPRYYFSFEEA